MARRKFSIRTSVFLISGEYLAFLPLPPNFNFDPKSNDTGEVIHEDLDLYGLCGEDHISRPMVQGKLYMRISLFNLYGEDLTFIPLPPLFTFDPKSNGTREVLLDLGGEDLTFLPPPFPLTYL
jgi:hypothetical protein